MNEPPRKRRKTSSPPRPPSSPLRKPPRRPSFASPTKASLARSYPSLLPTRTPPRDDVHSRTKQAHAYALDGNNIAPDNTEEGAEEEEEELPLAKSQREVDAQEVPHRDAVFPPPTKRPPRAPSTVVRFPLESAPSVQQNQRSRPVEDALDKNGSDKKARRPHIDSVVEQRKQERARLQREVEELEAQVSRCTKEITAEQQRAAEDILLLDQRADLINFITKISGAAAQYEPPPSVSSLLCSFLPFSSLAIPPPQPTHPEKPIASHQPVELSDPLPYLQMFTSLSFSTQLGLPRGKILPASKRVHQKHIVTITGPQKLLTAQVATNIDCLANEVIDMHVLRLPSWAERELGAFMRVKAQERDLGNACWAISSFWDIAIKRAQYWHKCERAFMRLLPERTADDSGNVTASHPKPSTLSRKSLSRHLGRNMLILQDKHVLLKINWRISLDWTGEAESDVDVECAVPPVWKEADTSDTFRKIPETFDLLLRTKGAFEATRILVALLFSH